jgi:hypothetical protein
LETGIRSPFPAPRLWQSYCRHRRRLLVVLWNILSKRQSYRHLTDTQIASKMMRWSWKVRKHHPEAVASRLMTLEVGKKPTSFKYNNLPSGLASEEEALVLTPE